MSANANAPIIIKRVKKGGGDGHHGGAWKVAYADFVTAMMAFFMLMWLLNATTETQRKGIADYFSPTIPINRISGGGDGAFGGDSIFAEESLAQNGTGAASSMSGPAKAESQHQAIGRDGPDSGGTGEAFESVEEVLSARGGESMVSELLQRHIVTKVTDEGLIIELHDLPDAPLFMGDTREPQPILVDLIAMLREVFKLVPNRVAINGHLAKRPLVFRENPVWDLSIHRADEVRQMFERAGLTAGRIERVTGFADRKLISRNPLHVRNNRVEVILLRGRR